MTVRIHKIDGRVYLQMRHKDMNRMREINYYEDISKEDAILLIIDLKKAFRLTREKKGE